MKEQPIISEQAQIKAESHNEVPHEKTNFSNASITEQEQTPINSPSLNPIPSDHQIIPPPPTTIINPESTSSSRSTSRTSSETKTDTIKVKF